MNTLEYAILDRNIVDMIENLKFIRDNAPELFERYEDMTPMYQAQDLLSVIRFKMEKRRREP
jgi:hypothetical protein